jgi:hypothetical protein
MSIGWEWERRKTMAYLDEVDRLMALSDESRVECRGERERRMISK